MLHKMHVATYVFKCFIRMLLPCVWFGDQVGWVGMNLVFWDGMNPSHVWFEGWSRSSFFFGTKVEWVGMDGTVNSVSSYLRGT